MKYTILGTAIVLSIILYFLFFGSSALLIFLLVVVALIVAMILIFGFFLGVIIEDMVENYKVRKFNKRKQRLQCEATPI